MVKTFIEHRGKLNHWQLVRLGGLIAFVCGRTPYIMDQLESEGFVEEYDDDCFALTQKGQEELEKLTSMAGLRTHQYSNNIEGGR